MLLNIKNIDLLTVWTSLDVHLLSETVLPPTEILLTGSILCSSHHSIEIVCETQGDQHFFRNTPTSTSSTSANTLQSITEITLFLRVMKIYISESSCICHPVFWLDGWIIYWKSRKSKKCLLCRSGFRGRSLYMESACSVHLGWRFVHHSEIKLGHFTLSTALKPILKDYSPGIFFF